MAAFSDSYWDLEAGDLLARLETSPQGLSAEAASARLDRFGPNLLKPRKRTDAITLLLNQFRSPIILILIGAAMLSYFLHDRTDAIVILSIVIVSGLLGFWQEKGAADAVLRLLSIVQTTARVFRDNLEQEIPMEDVVPGDVMILSAGAIVPGDCLLLESKDLFVNEAALTGESYPAEKSVGVLPGDTLLAKRTNCLFMGTHIVSGTGKAVVVTTGPETEFGKVSEELKLRPPETDFERGVRRFGYLLMEITLILVIAIFAFNVYFRRPILDSFLFALALAVGLTPQLLPAIVSINLAHGAKRLAENKVIVKRLASIENFGSMNVLCSDKTGTITEGVAHIHSVVDIKGQDSEKALRYAYLNAVFQTGFANPIDEAIRNYRKFDISAWRKVDEIPYDFIRKRLTILVAQDGTNTMVTKGALQNVLAVCRAAELHDGQVADIASMRDEIRQRYESFSAEGYRTLGIAYRQVGAQTVIKKDHEADMIFLGFLVLYDPPKPEIMNTLVQLRKLRIQLKVITGDNSQVATTIVRQIGVSRPRVLTGTEIRNMSDEALTRKARVTEVFAEVEPNQKEQIILALKKAGKVVGFLGDGINDASALHAADVGISVESAVDVAKEAADIVLLEKELEVLVQGVREGRRTFANTLKYVFMASSANFGNMFSMAGASLFMPFLPLLPKQILLMNLLTDFPEMAIATDSVDPDMVTRPRRWNIKFIRNFMLVFGPLSSVFDYLTFGVLLLVMHANMGQFRTGWFVESVISASLIVLVIRTRKRFLRSRPGKYLLAATLLLVIITLILPYTGFGRIFGFHPLPASFLLIMGAIVLLYIVSAEIVKGIFYRKLK